MRWVSRFKGSFTLIKSPSSLGKGRDVVEGVFDREGLALGIHGDDRGLVQRIGDRREVALAVIAKRRGVAQRSVTVLEVQGQTTPPSLLWL